jgi:hypothetical protein
LLSKAAACLAIHDVSYNSCRDRHCPKCQGVKRAQWLETRRRGVTAGVGPRAHASHAARRAELTRGRKTGSSWHKPERHKSSGHQQAHLREHARASVLAAILLTGTAQGVSGKANENPPAAHLRPPGAYGDPGQC